MAALAEPRPNTEATEAKAVPEVAEVEDQKLDGPALAPAEPPTLDEKNPQLEPELAQPPGEYTGHHHYVFARLRRRLPPLSHRRKIAIRWAGMGAGTS